MRAVPCADKVRFSSTGTEATLYAMRAARAYRRKDKILKFEGGFHGMNDYSLMSIWPLSPGGFPPGGSGFGGNSALGFRAKCSSRRSTTWRRRGR